MAVSDRLNMILSRIRSFVHFRVIQLEFDRHGDPARLGNVSRLAGTKRHFLTASVPLGQDLMAAGTLYRHLAMAVSGIALSTTRPSSAGGVRCGINRLRIVQVIRVRTRRRVGALQGAAARSSTGTEGAAAAARRPSVPAFGSTRFTSEFLRTGFGLGFLTGLGSGFFTSFGGTGGGGTFGWATAGVGGADRTMSIIGSGAASVRGKGAGRLTYQKRNKPCSTAARAAAAATATGRFRSGISVRATGGPPRPS